MGRRRAAAAGWRVRYTPDHDQQAAAAAEPRMRAASRGAREPPPPACMAMPLTSVLKASPAATKSVSQLTSSSTPRRLPGWM